MSSTPFILTSFHRSYRPAPSRWPAFWMAAKAWAPVLCFVAIFALESTASFGTDHTSGPLRSAYEGLTGHSATMNWSYIHHIIRKVGHFSGYGIFSLVCFRAFKLTLRRTSSTLHRALLCHGLAIASAALIASADEIHQSFLPNRTGIFADVVLDTVGATALQLVLFLTMRVISSWPARPARQNESLPARQLPKAA